MYNVDLSYPYKWINNNMHITCIRLNVAIHEVHSTSYESRTVTYPECIT